MEGEKKRSVCVRVCERVWVDDDTNPPTTPSLRVSSKGTQLSVWSEKPIREIVCVLRFALGYKAAGGVAWQHTKAKADEAPLRVPPPYPPAPAAQRG